VNIEVGLRIAQRGLLGLHGAEPVRGVDGDRFALGLPRRCKARGGRAVLRGLRLEVGLPRMRPGLVQRPLPDGVARATRVEHHPVQPICRAITEVQAIEAFARPSVTT
jgi:hypothetical protein